MESSCPCKCRRECAFAPYLPANKPEELYAFLSEGGIDLTAAARMLVCCVSHRTGQEYVDWLCHKVKCLHDPSLRSHDDVIPPDELELRLEIAKRESGELLQKLDLIYAARTRELDLIYAARTRDHDHEDPTSNTKDTSLLNPSNN